MTIDEEACQLNALLYPENITEELIAELKKLPLRPYKVKPMTTDEYSKLTDDELNRLTAERVMGWKLDCVTHEGNIWWAVDHYVRLSDWQPATDYNHAAQVRRKIERQGLQWKFWSAMRTLIGYPFDAERVMKEQVPFDWYMLDASPKQTCVAALAAKGESK